MEIREYKTYNELEILRLYQRVGWTAYTDHPEILKKGFESSMLPLQLTRASSFLVSFEPLVMGIPSCLCRTFWGSRSISEKASAPHSCKLFWTDTAMGGRLSWQRTTHRKRQLSTSLWASGK